MHRGSVVVVDAPGGGAIFQIELPVRAPDGAFVRMGRIRMLWNRRKSRLRFYLRCLHLIEVNFQPGKPRVLVAEDNPDLRLFLHDVLSDEYNVILREDGESAFQAALANPPDLIITDLMMPGWDGERFVRALSDEPDVSERTCAGAVGARRRYLAGKSAGGTGQGLPDQAIFRAGVAGADA